jgi:hypothetical protein
MRGLLLIWILTVWVAAGYAEDKAGCEKRCGDRATSCLASCQRRPDDTSDQQARCVAACSKDQEKCLDDCPDD